MSKLSEWVDEVIANPDIGDHTWVPNGWIKKKKGPVHVQQLDEGRVAWCGDELNTQVISLGPARAMLRRADPCRNCEAAVGKDEEE